MDNMIISFNNFMSLISGLMPYNGTACRSPGSECQERAALNWLTFISNQFTAAPA
jgi:hypothetical protein